MHPPHRPPEMYSAPADAEPAAPGGAADPPPAVCRNCAAPLDPAHLYCPTCGQDTATSRATVAEIARDVWSEFLQVDSKLFRTLLALLLRPGHLTAEYVAGKRMRYLSPFKMYLVVAALFFALASWVGSLQAERAAAIAPKIIETGAATPDKAGGKSYFAVKTASPPAKPSALAAPIQISASDDNGPRNLDSFLPDTIAAYETKQNALPPDKRDEPQVRFLMERLIHVRSLWREDKGGLVASLVGYFPGTMFFLLPVFALLLKVLYARRDWFYVEHLVFGLHLHTVFFIVCGLNLLLAVPTASDAAQRLGLLGPAEWALWLGFGVYGFLAARRVYGQGIAKTLAKGGCLVSAYFGIVVVAVIATLVYALTRV